MSVTAKNGFLSEEEMKGNASYIWSFLSSRGWTKNAVAGMLGNMETESTINPAIWQNLDADNTSLGFGLVQWTPATKLIVWASARDLDYGNIDTQLERILWELENGEQYYATDAYPLSFREFSESSQSPEYLAQAFLLNYERPADQTQPARSTQARKWFEYLGGGSTGGESGDTPDEDDPVRPNTPDESIKPKPKRRVMSLLLKYKAIRR